MADAANTGPAATAASNPQGPLPADDPEVVQRLKEMREAYEAQLQRARVQQAADAEFHRLFPNAPRVGTSSAQAGPSSGNPLPTAALAQASADDNAPRRPFLPAPEKWAGTVAVTDNNNSTLNNSGKVWLAGFESYCAWYQMTPLDTLQYFLKDKALEWLYGVHRYASITGMALTWQAVRYEFLRQYTPADRRAPASVARTKLQNHECTMTQFPTVSQYDNAFRILLREIHDMSHADQIHWFLSGLSPTYKRHCATQPDGTDWTDLLALIQFALGVEARENAATVHHSFKRLNYTSTTASATQQDRNPKQARRGNGGPSAPKQPKDDSAPREPIPPEVPPPMRSLWLATKGQKWKDPDGKEYTGPSWRALIDAKRCVQCHKARPGECTGHGYQKKPKGSAKDRRGKKGGSVV
jgi:hypothetical protein